MTTTAKAIAVQIRDNAKSVIETAIASGQLADSNFYVDASYYNVIDLSDDSWWDSDGNYSRGRVIIEPVPQPCKAITRENCAQYQYSIRVLLQKPIDPSDTTTIDTYILLWEQIGNLIRRSTTYGISFYGAEPAVGQDGVPMLYLGIRDNMFVAQSDFIFTVIQK